MDPDDADYCDDGGGSKSETETSGEILESQAESQAASAEKKNGGGG